MNHSSTQSIPGIPSLQAHVQATIKARRVRGGAVVRVVRDDGRENSYRVGLRRYRALNATLVAHDGTLGGWFTSNGFEARLKDVTGLDKSRQWVKRNSPRLYAPRGVAV